MESIMQVLRRNSLTLQPGTADIVFSICYNADRWDLLSKYAERFVKAGVKLHRTAFDIWMEFAAKVGGLQAIWNINSLRGNFVEHTLAAVHAFAKEFLLERHPESAAGIIKLIDKRLHEQKKLFIKDELQKLIAEWPSEVIKNQKKDDREIFLVSPLRSPHGEDGMLAVAARARRLVFPVTSGLSCICAGPFIGSTSGSKGVPPHLGSIPSSLHIARSFSSSPESPPDPSPSKYLTAWSQEAVAINNISGCINLAELFKSEPELCFDNYQSKVGKHCFSNLSLDIFKLLITISYNHIKDDKRRFKFDPSKILVRRCGRVVIDVLVPQSQLLECEEDDNIELHAPTNCTQKPKLMGKGVQFTYMLADKMVKSIYVDNVAGPFAALVYMLHLRWVKSVHARKDNTYWEICDMLEMSMKGKWWNSLEDLLEHPFFSSLEKKYTAITCSYMWMTPPQANISHGIPGFTIKKRKKGHEDFINGFAKNFFYLKEYIVTKTALGEYHVTSVSNRYKDWKKEYIGAGTLGAKYKFGSRKGNERYADAEELIRHLGVHFGDDNFAVIRSKLHSPTLKNGLIESERTFTFH